MGRLDPTLEIAGDEVRLARHTPEGPVTLRLAPRGAGVLAQAWGPGGPWALRQVPALCGALDCAQSFDPAPGPIRELWRRFHGLRLPRWPSVFERVVQVTLLQLVTWKDAVSAWRRLVERLGQPAPGPFGLRLPPAAERLAAASQDHLTALGVLPRQARTVLRVARAVDRLERAAALGPGPLSRALEELPGIGPWSVHYVLGSAMGVSDTVLPGDYDLPHLVAWTLAGERRGSEARMLELLEPYRGHRFRVIRLLWAGGAGPPRRAPRLSRWGQPR